MEKKLTPEKLAAVRKVKALLDEIAEKGKEIDALTDKENIGDHFAVFFSATCNDPEDNGDVGRNADMMGCILGSTDRIIDSLARTAAGHSDASICMFYAEAIELAMQFKREELFEKATGTGIITP